MGRTVQIKDRKFHKLYVVIIRIYVICIIVGVVVFGIVLPIQIFSKVTQGLDEFESYQKGSCNCLNPAYINVDKVDFGNNCNYYYSYNFRGDYSDYSYSFYLEKNHHGYQLGSSKKNLIKRILKKGEIEKDKCGDNLNLDEKYYQYIQKARLASTCRCKKMKGIGFELFISVVVSGYSAFSTVSVILLWIKDKLYSNDISLQNANELIESNCLKEDEKENEKEDEKDEKKDSDDKKEANNYFQNVITEIK